jgi:O-antigen/teichoic acid export membrane protein
MATAPPRPPRPSLRNPKGALGWLREMARNPAIRQRVIAPVSFDASILVINTITGVIIARKLGPSGRGELTATLAIVQTAGWLASMGGRAAISFHHSQNPEHGGRLMTSWLLAAVPLSLLAILGAELLLPTIFGAQTAEAIHIARIYAPLVLINVFSIVFIGILLGDQRFLAYNVVRMLIPVVTVLGYVVFLIAGDLTVTTALISNGAALVVSTVISAGICFRQHGLERPSRNLLKTTIWYGVRAHGGDIAGFVSARLDLLIIPAFLSAASVGLYSVATNVGSIIASLTATIAVFALPVAARDAKRASHTVVRAFQVTLLIGGSMALVLVVICEVAIKLVYGDAFAAAAPPLRVLLPGEVLEAASIVLLTGMLAANRPFLSTVAYAPSAIFTIAGLLIFLQSGGIMAAAIVTTCAYTVSFVITVILYKRLAGLEWRHFLRPPPGSPPTKPIMEE